MFIFKSIENAIVIISTVCVLGNVITSPALATSEDKGIKKDACLKNNNGIGNNHDIYYELPTNSSTLGDSENKISSIRIDPGNPGQMRKFEEELTEQGFEESQIEFVVNQIWDAEMKLQQKSLLCISENSVDSDYTVLPD